MEQYFAAKRRLFQMLDADAHRHRQRRRPARGRAARVVPVAVTYGITQPADVTPGPFELEIGGLTLDVRTPKGSVAVRSSLVGRPNVYNILAAAATAVALDLPLEAVARGVHALPGVPGRFEVVSGPAMTSPSSSTTRIRMTRCATCSRPRARWRRNGWSRCSAAAAIGIRTKRPLMGMVAARLSDVVIVTSDNPRSEDPARIIDEIRRGITPASHAGRQAEVASVVDRAEAIERAVSLARARRPGAGRREGPRKVSADWRSGAAVR